MQLGPGGSTFGIADKVISTIHALNIESDSVDSESTTDVSTVEDVTSVMIFACPQCRETTHQVCEAQNRLTSQRTHAAPYLF